MTIAQTEEWLSDAARRPLLMGVLNVTPDSFSDGGLYERHAAAAARVRDLLAEGADWLDIGAESTRPGSDPVDAAEQIRRLLPAVEVAVSAGAVVSVDTTRAEVAERALDAGAAIINDITAGTGDDRMPAVMTRAKAVVLMHMQGTPRTMQEDPTYQDVVAEVEDYLLARAAAVEAAGVERQRILIDPGIGFGKEMVHNLLLLRALPRLARHGYPVLVGPSRKGFIGTLTGETAPERRQFGTAAAVAWCVTNSAAVVRVHDVAEMRQVLAVALAIGQAGRG
jgi:dihydropteroate synthase